MLVDKFIEFLKEEAKENEIRLGEEYRKEFYFKDDSIGFYLTSISKDKLEKFLQSIYKKGEDLKLVKSNRDRDAFFQGDP